MAGNCDAGYSCVYVSTMAWRSATQPLPKRVNPKLVFERLFGSGSDANRAKRDEKRKSILDFVREETATCTAASDANEPPQARRILQRRPRPGAAHQEGGNVAAGQDAGHAEAGRRPGELRRTPAPDGDLLVLAFQADVTRVCTFVLSNEASTRRTVPRRARDASRVVAPRQTQRRTRSC